MKKAKIMLTSLAIVGVVGGVLAFNAKLTTPVYTCPATGEVPNALASTLVANVGSGPDTIIATTTTADEATCTVLSVVFE